MALTISNVKRTVFGNDRVAIADVTFDSSYATGGELLDISQLGMQQVDYLAVAPASGYAVEWDGTNKKLLVRGTGSAEKAAFTQQDASTDLSTLTVHIMAYGN